jgi:hypothetical protein
MSFFNRLEAAYQESGCASREDFLRMVGKARLRSLRPSAWGRAGERVAAIQGSWPPLPEEPIMPSQRCGDAELARRELFPAHTDKIGLTRPQTVTVAELEAEIASGSREEWNLWELALAKRQREVNPGKPFIHCVYD